MPAEPIAIEVYSKAQDYFQDKEVLQRAFHSIMGEFQAYKKAMVEKNRELENLSVFPLSERRGEGKVADYVISVVGALAAVSVSRDCLKEIIEYGPEKNHEKLFHYLELFVGGTEALLELKVDMKVSPYKGEAYVAYFTEEDKTRVDELSSEIILSEASIDKIISVLEKAKDKWASKDGLAEAFKELRKRWRRSLKELKSQLPYAIRSITPFLVREGVEAFEKGVGEALEGVPKREREALYSLWEALQIGESDVERRAVERYKRLVFVMVDGGDKEQISENLKRLMEADAMALYLFFLKPLKALKRGKADFGALERVLYPYLMNKGEREAIRKAIGEEEDISRVALEFKRRVAEVWMRAVAKLLGREGDRTLAAVLARFHPIFEGIHKEVWRKEPDSPPTTFINPLGGKVAELTNAFEKWEKWEKEEDKEELERQMASLYSELFEETYFGLSQELLVREQPSRALVDSIYTPNDPDLLYIHYLFAAERRREFEEKYRIERRKVEEGRKWWKRLLPFGKKGDALRAHFYHILYLYYKSHEQAYLGAFEKFVGKEVKEWRERSAVNRELIDALRELWEEREDRVVSH